MTENKPRILIVEDDENIRKTLENILQQKGYETDTAKTGREAEQKKSHRLDKNTGTPT